MAEQCRQVANTIDDPIAKAMMYQVADDYDRIATEAERANESVYRQARRVHDVVP